MNNHVSIILTNTFLYYMNVLYKIYKESRNKDASDAVLNRRQND